MKRNLYLIGVTGNICTGKSHCAKYLGAKSNSFYSNMDILGHKVYERNFLLLNSIKRVFANKNQNIFQNKNSFNETFNRKELGKVVFDNKQELEKLNSLIRPEIRTLLNETVNTLDNELKLNNKKGILFVEGAIIIEGGFQNYFDEVWMTTTNREEIEKRFLARLEKENMIEYKTNILPKILNAQMDDKDKMKYSKEIIDTTGTMEESNKKYDESYTKLLKRIELI